MGGEFPSDVALPNIEIHVGELCNNRCTFCTTGWANRDTRDLAEVPREVIRQQLETAFAAGARRALFQGGEPTLRRDLGDLVGDAYGLGFQAVTVFTNARIAASEAGARWLSGMKVRWFQVSVQGGTPAEHDEAVGAKGAFEQTLGGARRLLALGQRVKVNAVLTRHLLNSFPEFAELMIGLAPEEVGCDLVSPSKAFAPGRSDYATLVPALTPYLPRIAEGLLRMERAGVTVRLTNYPACLAPGVEHLVSGEAPVTHTHMTDGTCVPKQLWRRTLQVKAPGCASCAYDSTCGGLYHAYAAAHGEGELHALASRAAPVARRETPVADSALTQAFRALFIKGSSPAFGVRTVTRRADGSHELECYALHGSLRVFVQQGRAEGLPAYARTEKFSISYEPPANGHAADLRIVDAVQRALQRFERKWPAGAAPGTEKSVPAR